MQDLSPAFESQLLHLLILACWCLAIIGAILWVICFCWRLHRLNGMERAARMEERLTEAVLTLSVSPDPDPTAFEGLRPWEHAILVRVCLTLIDQTQGSGQQAVVNLMRRMGFARHALRLLSRGTPEDRQAACALLGVFDGNVASDALSAAMRDPDVGVRLTAARALLKKNQVPSLRHLLTALQLSPEDPPIMLADIFNRLPETLHHEAVGMLVDPMPVEWKRMLVIALGRRQVLEAFDAIASLRLASEGRLRSAAWVALRELGNPRAGEMAVSALNDPEADVRITAAQCVGALGGAAELGHLVRLLADADWWVKYHAAAALHDAGPEGRRLLRGYCQSAGADDVAWQVSRERGGEDSGG
jgi:hypothetical protein